ncbi:hypothetical protein D3C84_1042650 [compost metagenome]
MDDFQAAIERTFKLGGAPIASQRRIEHLAQPVQDDWVLGLAKHLVVDATIVGRGLRHAGERATGHQDQAAVQTLDSPHLFAVGTQYVIDG